MIPAEIPKIEKHYKLGEARVEEASQLEAAISRAYFNEHGWSAELPARMATVRRLVGDDLPDQIMSFLTLRHGNRIIGAVVGNPDATAANNIPAGVCVLSEYRSRGLGTFLLYQVLHRLKEKGLGTCHAVTKKGLVAERFLYRKFGGKVAPLAPEITRC